MKNLFKILEKKEDEYIIELTNKDHEVFKAHFPDNKLLPAFLQIDIIANILEHKIKRIQKAKFLSIIKPNDKIKYCIHTNDNNSYKIVIKGLLNNKISEFTYEI
ncbi:hypothetical protein [Aliarcobacter vitoriensis]|uniref:ApeI dehydratase-like domain-containing protein n=1 Tax=Aliarcobacter vitoriensis TaxID=2011099 RepID=A0A366MQ98_9BACT|nr:hypothetical protein [Aliarcobacter vitoriensis]RBQ28023.1 hypothetical protein CRU91_11425 [Aliarcobacter vitoriensis]RBQ30741.1 hypothetical protein CRU92_10365 [Arcobacter sp. FW59]